MGLKYLFSVKYKDGSIFEQPKDDHSELDSLKSSFYDVLQNEKEMESFSIRTEDHEDCWSVNLSTGAFIHNGVEFVVQGDKPLPIDNPEFRLVFYRQHNHSFGVSEYGLDQTELAHTVAYFIGWQCTIDKKNYQQVIGVK